MSEQTAQTINEFRAELTIQKQDLEQLLTLIKNTTEEAQLNLDSEGITCRYMDPSHVCLMDIALIDSMFEKYEVNTPSFISLYNIEKMLKAVKKFSDNTPLWINATNDTWKIYGQGLSFTFKQHSQTSNDTPLPKIPYDVCIEVRDVQQIIKDHKTVNDFADYLTYCTTQNNLIIKAKSEDIEELKQTYDPKFDGVISSIKCKEESETMYSLEYIMQFLNSLDKGMPLTIEYSTQKPLRYETRIANTGRIHYYLAPRIEND